MKNYPNLSREERGNMIRGAMIRLTDGRDLEIPQAPPTGQAPGTPPGGSPNNGVQPQPQQIQTSSGAVRIEVRTESRGGDGRENRGDRGDRR